MVLNLAKITIPQRTPLYVKVFWAAILILLFTNVTKADFSTPFTEINNKIGDVSEAHGYVIAKDPNLQESIHFWVIVRNDRMERVFINATARKNVVPNSLLDKEVIIGAKVVSRKKNAKTKKIEVELEILSVRPPEEQKKRDSR